MLLVVPPELGTGELTKWEESWGQFTVQGGGIRVGVGILQEVGIWEVQLLATATVGG